MHSIPVDSGSVVNMKEEKKVRRKAKWVLDLVHFESSALIFVSLLPTISHLHFIAWLRDVSLIKLDVFLTM